MIIRLLKLVYRYMLIKMSAIGYARKIGVNVGSNCRFLGITGNTFGSEPYLISIGNHVTITAETQFVTHDGGVWVFREREPKIELCRPIVIGNNVFIGFRSIVLAGVTIGDNVVIGAGSIVTKDIADNSVVAGVPAKVIRTVDEYRATIEPFTFDRTWANEKEKRAFLSNMFRKTKYF